MPFRNKLSASRYLRASLRSIDDSMTVVVSPEARDGSEEVGLRAGWAKTPIELPEGTPLAGYGDRKGRPSEGVHDTLEASALALGYRRPDGSLFPQAVVLTADILVVTDNIARKVRAAVPIPILFNASHTHAGPGASMRGLIARAFGGAYDSRAEAAIVGALVDAALDAGSRMTPVQLSYGSQRVDAYIRNRTRDVSATGELVDAYLDVLAFESQTNGLCTVVRYSAHPTILGSENMLFSAGFPGALKRRVEQEIGGIAIYLGGSIGSMAASPPEGGDDFGRAQAMGEALAAVATQEVVGTPVDGSLFAVLDAPIRLPPVQLRLARWLRVSPILLALNGVDRSSRMSAVAIGDLVLMGFPGDLSGEIGAAMRGAAASGSEPTIRLLPLSFGGDYAGYISPDEYYSELRDESGLRYETGIMSWTGPNQAAYFSALAEHVVDILRWYRR